METAARARDDLLDEGLSWLLARHPFFGHLILRLKLVSNPAIPTAGASSDGRIHYAPRFIAQLLPAEAGFVLAHETLHIALRHHARMGSRERGRWNRACDYAVNAWLVDAGFAAPRPEIIQILYRRQFKRFDEEEIYDLLNVGQDEEPEDLLVGGADDEVLDEAGLRVAVEQAGRQARLAGQEPSGLERMLVEATAEPYPWKRILARHLTRLLRGTRSYAAASRRGLVVARRAMLTAGKHVRLPGRSADRGDVVVAIDSSGSIDNAELAGAVADVQQIVVAHGRSVRLLVADAAVGVDQPLRRGEAVQRLPGGGGSDTRPVFEALDRSSAKPGLVIFFTDLATAFPATAPDYPVVWITNGRASAPFGVVIRRKQ